MGNGINLQSDLKIKSYCTLDSGGQLVFGGTSHCFVDLKLLGKIVQWQFEDRICGIASGKVAQQAAWENICTCMPGREGSCSELTGLS